MKFYLGSHLPSWLWRDTPPLCVARQRLEDRRMENLTPATGPWFLDSGGFTELGKYGKWTVTPARYIELAREFHTRIGQLEWIAPQDWMCEPQMIKRTGLSVREHQERTISNGLLLRELAPELPIRYAVQGYTIDEYLECVDLYRSAGVDLTAEPLVGIGSVCRRENTVEIYEVFKALHGVGLRMHGFGVKSRGFNRYAQFLTSADSLAWSFNARRYRRPMPGCEGRGHINCANCLRYATQWYGERTAQLAQLLGPAHNDDNEGLAA